jgi:nucleoside diphosphate kinase
VLVQSKKLRLTRNDAEAFYAEHKGRILWEDSDLD